MNQPTAPAARISSIDILRGIVMIIMALDHTRDFLHVTAMTADPMDPATTSAALFFTRWITHFCAPVFVLLSGLSARISSARRTDRQMAVFLAKRGAWLIFIEITVVSFALTFNPTFNFIILQVIWAIGGSMLLLALFIRYFKKGIFWFGLLLLLGHNVLDLVSLPQTGAASVLLKIFFTAFGTVLPIGQAHALGVFYALLPWTALLFLGYAMGTWFLPGTETRQRQKNLFLTGLGLFLGFVLLRFFNIYGNPQPWVPGKTFAASVFSFLGTSKYPPSLQYVGMTLGPALMLMAWFETWKFKPNRLTVIYGRVPFFYYVLHLYLLHLMLMLAFFARGYAWSQAQDPNSIFMFRPVQFGFPLWAIYVFWILAVALLYLPCRWFGQYKRTHSQWWLHYL